MASRHMNASARRSIAVLFGLLALTVVSGCGPDAGQEGGDCKCVSNCGRDGLFPTWGCDGELICNQEPFKCEKAHSVKAGGECSKDDLCAGDLRCNAEASVWGICQLPGSVPEGGKCSSQDFCSGDLICDCGVRCYGSCRKPHSVPAGGFCYQSTVCSGDLICNETTNTCENP